MFKYLELIKPKIVFGNIVLIIGSFFFASSHSFFSYLLFFYTIIGTSLVISSACIFNNLIDRDVDKKMQRTSNRILLKEMISPVLVLFFAIFLGILGTFILGLLVNFLSMILSIFGFFVYVVLYTILYKRKSIYSTFIGSFSGSTPSVIGYTAVTNTIDLCAILLFFIIIFWQMAHFYAISIIRISDYKKANIPLFCLIKGIFITKQHIFYYILSFTFFSSLLTLLGYTSFVFLLVFFIFNCYWICLSFLNIKWNDDKRNATKLFYYSIVMVIIFNILISIDFLF